MQEPTEPRDRPRRIRRGIMIAIALLAAAFLGVWFLSPPPATLDQPVRLERDGDGTLRDVSGGEIDANPMQVALHAGKLKSNNSTTTATSSSHSEPAWFQCKSLLVLSSSDHLLMRLVGDELLEHLKSLQQLDRIDYLPFGHSARHGMRAPDAVVNIDLVSLNESGILGRDLEAKISATLGTAIAASNHSVNDHLTPPVVTFHARIGLDHSSSLQGVELAGARYALQADDIAKELAKTIDNELTKLREKHDARPQLPAELVPEFREPLAFDFLTRHAARELTSFHGLMLHNETFWQLEEPNDPTAAVTAIHEQLLQEGWKGRLETEIESTPRFYMTKGARVVEIFRNGQGTTLATDAQRAKPHPLCVRYRDRMNRSQLQEVLQPLLDADQPDIELLLALRRYGSRAQSERLLEMVESNPPQSAAAWLALANWYASKKDKQAALQALNRTHILSLTLADASHEQSRIKQLAKKLELDEKHVREIDPAVFEDIGFLRLDADSPAAEVEIRGNELARFFVPDPRSDSWGIIATSVKQLTPSSVEITRFQADDDGGRSRSSVSGLGLSSPYQDRTQVNGQPVAIRVRWPEDGVALVSAQLTPANDDSQE